MVYRGVYTKTKKNLSKSRPKLAGGSFQCKKRLIMRASSTLLQAHARPGYRQYSAQKSTKINESWAWSLSSSCKKMKSSRIKLKNLKEERDLNWTRGILRGLEISALNQRLAEYDRALVNEVEERVYEPRLGHRFAGWVIVNQIWKMQRSVRCGMHRTPIKYCAVPTYPDSVVVEECKQSIWL